MHIGLSEPDSQTIRRGHAVHPIAAVQAGYSLCTRDPKAELLPLLRELAIGLVAHSPLGRGFLAGHIRSSSDMPSVEENTAADDLVLNGEQLQQLSALPPAAGARFNEAYLKRR